MRQTSSRLSTTGSVCVWGGRINDRLVNVLPSVRSMKNLMPHRAMVTVARA